MPVRHTVDSTNKIIITVWTGDATDQEFVEAITKYQKDFKENPDYQNYNELADFSQVNGIQLTTEGIRLVGQIAAKHDANGKKTKAALVVTSALAYGFARMYEIYRNLMPNSNKQVKVFKSINEAYEWLGLNKIENPVSTDNQAA